LIKRIAKTSRYAAAALAAVLAVFLFLNVLYPLPVEKLHRPLSTAVYSKDGQLLRVFLSEDDYWRIHAPLDRISPFMRRAVVEYEDRWFYYHPGVNPVSLVRAAATNISAGRVVCGGSTITMQVARMMEPKSRTYLSKLLEIFRALQIEMRYSKNEILEIYLNMAPYGGNVEGAAAAAYFYFGKSPSVLDRAEALSLAILPNSPTLLRPDLHYDDFKKRRELVAARLRDSGLISPEDYKLAVSLDGPKNRTTPPLRAPHFARLATNEFPDTPNITTTLDLRIQGMCERTLRRHLDPLMARGITNGAVVVIENETRAVRAMVGSRDFFDSAHAGQVNGATAPRSPGSAMKPFAYALALDRGAISPRLLVNDVPVRYGAYSPANYDGEYRGGVPAEEALKLSLNVPAVNLVAELRGGFFSMLKKGGFTTLTRPRRHYGLPIVLGSCEATLLELSTLYSALADGGSYRRYRIAEDEELTAPVQLFSPGASYIISEILSEVRRPDLPNCWEFSINLPKVAWKTGTSYGHRDAWSVGYNPRYTVGVWTGNFSGVEAEDLVGSEIAAPILFDIFNLLSDGSQWFDRPRSVGVRNVCPLSGRPVSPDCPHSVEELYIYGVSPAKKCDMHRKILVDSDTGLRLSRGCTGGREYTEETLVVWPPRIATWMEREGYPVDVIPRAHPGCALSPSGGPPVIVSPQGDYYLREDAPLEHQKILLDASVSNNVRELFWFVDGKLLASGPPPEKHFYYPQRGRHHIVCMDSEGRHSAVNINILY